MSHSPARPRTSAQRVAALDRWVRAILLAVFLIVAAPLAAGTEVRDPPRKLIDYKHSRWTAAEHVPPIIYAITQDRRGYLILGSSIGLYRFDGISFEEIISRDRELVHGRILFLLKAQDGTIWVFYDHGMIATYRAGILRMDRSVPSTAPEPSGVAQSRDGTIWVLQQGTDRPFLVRRNGRWERVDGAFDVNDGTSFRGIFVSRDGTIWLESYETLYRRRENEERFIRVAKTFGRTKLSEDVAGHLWMSDDRGTRLLRPTTTEGNVYPTPSFRRWTAVTHFDRDGNLWIANGDGLFRVQEPRAGGSRTEDDPKAAVEGLSSKDGLTADTTTPLFEDREGNIWVGTTRGLDEFRKVSIINEPLLTVASANGAGLLAASDGSVYVGTTDALYQVPPHGKPKRLATALAAPRFICEAAHGEVVVMASNVFIYIKNGVLKKRSPPAIFSRHLGSDNIGGCALDTARGILWVTRSPISDAAMSLYGYRDGHWRIASPPGKLSPAALTSTRDGTTIALLGSGDIGPLDSRGRIMAPLVTHARIGGKPLRIAIIDRLIRSTSQGIVVGGPFGLARVHDRSLQVADLGRFPWLSGLTDLVETPQGQTWMLGQVGIVRVDTAELGRAFAPTHTMITPTIFDFEDGLPEVRNLSSQNGAVRGGDGRIWFNLVGGVVWIDPAKLIRNSIPPPVHIRGLLAGSVQYRDPPPAVELARGTKSIAISYAGLSFTVPRRVHFRYQLEGVDQDWVDAGERREAFYTNLGAGTYRFRVMAANNDGVWNREGATVTFTIPPTFIQSIWFKLLCLALSVLLIWILLRLRTRSVRARMQARFDVQTAERERIARELHDTLLQGVQGLTLVVQTAIEGLPAGNRSRETIEQALDRADAIIGDGRDQVLALRSDAAPDGLAEALRQAARSIAPGPIPICQFSVDGIAQAVRPEVSRELLRIAEEALRNAVRHASASRIAIWLHFSRQELALTVRDDGTGIAPQILARGRRGHYGLVGMRERADQMNGRLEIVTEPGRGTDIRLSVPAKIAYQNQPRPSWNRLGAAWRRRAMGER